MRSVTSSIECKSDSLRFTFLSPCKDASHFLHTALVGKHPKHTTAEERHHKKCSAFFLLKILAVSLDYYQYWYYLSIYVGL